MFSFLNLKEKILIIILGCFVISLVFIEYQNYSSIKNDYVLKINGKKISYLQFNQEIQKEFSFIGNKKKSRNSFQSFSKEERYNIQYKILPKMINEILFSQYAKSLGMKANNEEIKKWIFSDKTFFFNGKFDKEKFYFLIENMGFTFNQYINFVTEKILAYNFLQWVKNINFLTPIEIEQFINRITQVRVARLAKVNLKNFCKNIHISLEETYQYYKLNKKKFFFPEKIKISFILINPKNLEKNITVNKKEIVDWYEKNKKIFPTKDVHEKIVSLIKRKKSINIYNHIRRDLLTNFDGTLFSAEKISGMKVKHTGWFDYNHLPTDINDYIFRKIFINEYLLDIEGNFNNNYHIILKKDKNIFLIRIEEYIPKIFKPFNSVVEDIKKEIRKKILFEKSNFLIEKIISEVNQSKKKEIIFKKLNIKFSSPKHFEFKPLKNLLEKEIFSIHVSKKFKKSIYKSFKDDDGNYFLISLDSYFQKKIDNQKKEFLIKELKKYYTHIIYNCLTEQLYKKAKIEIKENIVSNYFFENINFIKSEKRKLIHEKSFIY